MDAQENPLLIDEVLKLHQLRADAWLNRDVDGYCSYYWEDASAFAVDGRLTVDEMRTSLTSTILVGGGPLTICLPPASDIAIQVHGDAIVTNYRWQSTFRTADGKDYERMNFETDVWLRRNGEVKIIWMHLTRLASTLLTK